MGLILMILAFIPLLVIVAARARRAGLGILQPSPGLVAALAVPFAMFFMIMDGPSEGAILLLAALALVLFAWAWVVEFITLMGLGDDAFPGRFDKPVWAAVMILLPPIGVIAFGVFRRAYWASVKPSAHVSTHELV